MSATMFLLLHVVLVFHLCELLLFFSLQDGWMALMFSCEHGHESVVETLLNGGATVDMQEKVLVYWIVFFLSV